MTRSLLLFIGSCLFLVPALSVKGGEPVPPASDLPIIELQAISLDESVADRAIQILRHREYDGLNGMFEVHRELLKKHHEGALTQDEKYTWARFSKALNIIGGQYDCHASHLYWYTELDKAMLAAKQQNKPILSLRLLGKLTDQCSCANSRFFRTALYANVEVSKYLRENYILHWSSERPVPKVTIDFGDGRKLNWTVTGNSIHYILDKDGKVFDAIPGLIGPGLFRQYLSLGHSWLKSLQGIPTEKHAETLKSYYASQSARMVQRWNLQKSFQQLRKRAAEEQPTGAPQQAAVAKNDQPKQDPPTAVRAAVLPVTKSVVEIKLVNALEVQKARKTFETDSRNADWNKLARIVYSSYAKLDAGSIALMKEYHPTVFKQIEQPNSLPESEPATFEKIVSKFEDSIALDSATSEMIHHLAIYQWFLEGKVKSMEDLNQKVYAELFLTPRKDPWLGLVSSDVYTALREGGLERTERFPQSRTASTTETTQDQPDSNPFAPAKPAQE